MADLRGFGWKEGEYRREFAECRRASTGGLPQQPARRDYQLIRETSWMTREEFVPCSPVSWYPEIVLPPTPVTGRKFGWLNAFSISAANSKLTWPTIAVRFEMRMSCCWKSGPVTTRLPVPHAPTPPPSFSMQSGPFAGAK